jgi:hypothetical protein
VGPPPNVAGLLVSTIRLLSPTQEPQATLGLAENWPAGGVPFTEESGHLIPAGLASAIAPQSTVVKGSKSSNNCSTNPVPFVNVSVPLTPNAKNTGGNKGELALKGTEVVFVKTRYEAA